MVLQWWIKDLASWLILDRAHGASIHSWELCLLSRSNRNEEGGIRVRKRDEEEEARSSIPRFVWMWAMSALSDRKLEGNWSKWSIACLFGRLWFLVSQWTNSSCFKIRLYLLSTLSVNCSACIFVFKHEETSSQVQQMRLCMAPLLNHCKVKILPIWLFHWFAQLLKTNPFILSITLVA